ncbi:MAG: serine hydrolase, partial [Myxococcales bacterium]|nr:serine hydrolase [Myxococcales bacterium]
MTRTTWAVAGAVTLLLGTGAYAGLSDGKSVRDIPAGTGYAAHELCTRTMHSGESYEHVLTRYIEPKVAPLPRFWNVEHTPERAIAVRTWLPLLGNPRSAIHRPGLGCTVIPPGTDPAEVRAQPFRPAAAAPPNPRPWPAGEGAPESGRLSASDSAALERHAEGLFGEPDPDPARQQHTTALLVARDGHLLYERYGQGYTRERPQLGWSMTKTLTALIAGTLALDRKLALDDAVGLPRWRDTAKQAITWRALLNMAPGLSWFEGYGGASDATEMLFSQPDQGAWAADRPRTSEPGTVFNYSTGFSNIAMLRMRQLLGGSHQAIHDHYQGKLFAPLGIRGAIIEPDASGTPVGGARGMLRPVDWL